MSTAPVEGGSAGVQFLDRDGGRVAYEVSGDGPLVFCVPGMGELRSIYRYTTPALVAKGFKVASVDLRGHGDSDATFSSYDDPAAASDVEALVDHLGGPAVIVGNSMGGAAAVMVAAARPELVAGLVLLGTLLRDQPTGAVTSLLQRLLMGGPWARAAWASYLPRLYPGRRPDDFAEHRAAIVASMRRPGYTQSFRKTTRTTHAPAEARLGEVRAPSLVVMGERDPDFRDPAAEARWLSERLKAELVMVPGAGHYPQAEYPEVVNPAVLAFVSQVFKGA
ncbi:MAG TPA: alpha/beta hydrolase [Acidimicrobiales bacterium]|nr:alpha/beta hydrolase [Acidimicrobiales bacterium]